MIDEVWVGLYRHNGTPNGCDKFDCDELDTGDMEWADGTPFVVQPWMDKIRIDTNDGVVCFRMRTDGDVRDRACSGYEKFDVFCKSRFWNRFCNWEMGALDGP